MSAGSPHVAVPPAACHHPLRLDGAGPDQLKAHLREAWDLTEWLFSGLVNEGAFQLQSDPLRNPLIFYFGHTAAFTLNKLGQAGLLEAPLDAGLQALLARGVDPVKPGELEVRQDWPSADRVRAFRDQAWEKVAAAIDRVDGEPAWDHPSWALVMGAEHERIHFETSSVLIRQLPLDAVKAPQGWQRAPSSGRTPANEPVPIEGGTVVLGKPATPRTYGWDNEFGHLEVTVAPFAVSQTLVSNGAYLRFVEAGGYQDPQWWSPEAWAWVQELGVTGPRFWRKGPQGRRLRTVFTETELPLDWPAEVNHHEASAFCRWAGARLPTEAEWALLSQDADRVDGDAVFHPGHNLKLAWCSPRGVRAGPPTPQGIHDPMGNVWQWLSDEFQPLPGFRTHPYYDDFSVPFFDPHHRTLRGGSWASTGATASEFYRLWFRPHFYQHAGFRLAWDG